MVSTTPLVSATGFQPDLGFAGPTGAAVGLGIINTTGSNQTGSVVLTKGKVASLEVFLENSGSTADTYTLKTSGSLPAGFAQKFIYKGKNVTSLVTVSGTGTTSGTTGAIAFPLGKKKGTSLPLASGGVIPLTWQIKATTSGSGTSFLTATSTTGTTGTFSDTIGFTVTK